MFFNGIGAIQRQIEKYRNLIPGADFAIDTDRNGVADGWYYGTSTSDRFIENNTQYWTPSTSGSWSGCIQTLSNIPNVQGHKYYFSSNISNIKYILIMGHTFQESVSFVNGQVSMIWDSQADTSLVGISFYPLIAGTQCFVNKPIIYDITDLPTEQQTIAWCDANIAPNITW